MNDEEAIVHPVDGRKVYTKAEMTFKDREEATRVSTLIGKAFMDASEQLEGEFGIRAVIHLTRLEQGDGNKHERE